MPRERERSQEAIRVNREALRLIADLQAELGSGDSNNVIRVESIYTRFAEISGTPLRDSYHFGQTIVNDLGGPTTAA